MDCIVRSLVREILKEDAYKKMTGKRFTADIEAVRDTVGKQGYFLHFTDTPKIGVNPKSKYVPGVYFYPQVQIESGGSTWIRTRNKEVEAPDDFLFTIDPKWRDR